MNYKLIEKDYGVIVKLIDSFTFRDHDTFFEIVKYIKDNHSKITVLDMNECDFIDSAALGMLVILSDEICSFNGEKVLLNAFGKVDRVLFAARFSNLYTMPGNEKWMNEAQIDDYVNKKFNLTQIKIRNHIEDKKTEQLKLQRLPELVMDEDCCVTVNGKRYKIVKQEELDLDLDI